MRRGAFQRAWHVSDRVLAQLVAAGPDSSRPRHEQWIWDGRPLAGQRVLVRCYHGLGDTIMGARFLPRVAALARELTVWAQPALIPLLATLPGSGRLLPLHDGDPDVAYDVQVELLEIPHALRVTLETLPADVPYLSVPVAARLSGHFSVGVVAQSGAWDPRRSIPAELLAPLAAIPGVAVYSLQPGCSLPGARDASSADLLLAAARVRALDLVVTVDTMMAHLAGALGVPTWTLLHRQADWRWLEPGRVDSPWYPTMRLFWQEQMGEWGPVAQQVLGELRGAVGARRSRRL